MMYLLMGLMVLGLIPAILTALSIMLVALAISFMELISSKSTNDEPPL